MVRAVEDVVLNRLQKNPSSQPVPACPYIKHEPMLVVSRDAVVLLFCAITHLHDEL